MRDVRLDRDPDMGTPRFVGRRSGFLSPPAPGKPPEAVAMAFIEGNGRIFTLHPTDIAPPAARVTRDVLTRHSRMRSLTWQQQKDGVAIYGATFVLNLTADNRIINASSRALHMPSVRFHDVVKVTQADVAEVVRKYLNIQHPTPTTQRPIAEIWYPLDQVSVVKAWDVMATRGPGPDFASGGPAASPAVDREAAVPPAESHPSLHRLIIRADTGKVVKDINLTWGAAEPATFNVYTNDSPLPMTPGPDAPSNFVPAEVSRTLVTLTALDTNASPAGWVTAGDNRLVGNNAVVYADRDDDDARDDSPLVAPSNRVFDYACDLSLDPAAYEAASQVQAFYTANRFHDRLYALGFDEAAGNFQADNFSRGGVGGDPLIVEVQNGGDLGFGHGNTAWYTGWDDGSMGKVQVTVFGRSTPHRCGALDAQLLMHEMTHGVSSRLIGNGFGLSTAPSRGLAEGWSDFVALSLLSEATDNAEGCYAIGTYAGVSTSFPTDLYYGIRRFPYSTDMTKAPQTLADVDPNQIDFPPEVPRNPRFGSEDADNIYNIGEVWCLALWECRAKLIARHGFAGNALMLRLVVDGMKLCPTDPTFTEARDALLQADLVNSAGVNQVALWEGFAKRGLGYLAWVPGGVTTVGVVESFDLPFLLDTRVAEVGGDGDGYVEPGEDADLVVMLRSCEMVISNVTASLSVASSNVTAAVTNAVLADIPAGGVSTSAPPFSFAVGAGFPGFTDAEFVVRVETDKGRFERPIFVRIGNPYDYPPEILSVAVTKVTENEAEVAWRTGIPSNGRVEYGISTNYGMSTALDPVMRTNHWALLPDLAKGVDYHFRIHATGTNGLAAVSEDRTFRTRSRVYVWSGSTATQELGTVEVPFRSLQAAAQAAKATGDDILVAGGTYTGTDPEAVLNMDGSDWDLSIEGGYSPDFATRNAGCYETVIDGQRQRRGIRLDNGATLRIEGMTVTRGTHQEWGGGIVVRSSLLLARKCLVTDNSATNGTANQNGAGIYATLGATVDVGQCTIVSNRAGAGGGLFAISDGSVLVVDDCEVRENAAGVGGGIEVELGADAHIIGTVISGNEAARRSGGVGVAPFATVSIARCTISDNSAEYPLAPEYQGGGGVSVGGNETLCTISDSLIYGNDCVYGDDLWTGFNGSTHAGYCNIGDIYGTLTTSNSIMSVDPLFANPKAGDFHLLYGSPCIDAGDPAYGGGEEDMDGEPRPFNAWVDIGADEFTDGDADRMADYWETTAFGSTTNSDGGADGDGDALDDFGEYMAQTDPGNPDTDADLAQDGWEVANGYDPLDRDMDGDGMWDGWEATHALNAFSNDAALNPDGDGHDNLCEFTADTDPHDSNSVLRMLYVGKERGGTRLDWQGGVSSWQWLEARTNFSNPVAWERIVAFPPPTPTNNAILLFGVTNSPVFFRIRAERL